MSQQYPRPPTLRMERGILTSEKTTTTATGRAITGGGTAITDEDAISTDDMTSITTGVMFVMITVAMATMGGGGIVMNDMTGITIGVMFVMTTVGIITSPRFDRISKMFAMRAMKSNKIARSCAGIIRSCEKIGAMAPAEKRSALT